MLFRSGQADCQQDIFYYRLLSGSSSFILEESSGRYFRPHLLVQGGALVTVPTGGVSSDFSNPISVTDLSSLIWKIKKVGRNCFIPM